MGQGIWRDKEALCVIYDQPGHEHHTFSHYETQN